MSEGHRVLRNLYPTASANSRTCNAEIRPTAKAPLKHPDLQWLVDDTRKINKLSHACHQASLLMRAKKPKGTCAKYLFVIRLNTKWASCAVLGFKCANSYTECNTELFQILEVTCEIFVLFHNLSQFWNWKLSSSDSDLQNPIKIVEWIWQAAGANDEIKV